MIGECIVGKLLYGEHRAIVYKTDYVPDGPYNHIVTERQRIVVNFKGKTTDEVLRYLGSTYGVKRESIEIV